MKNCLYEHASAGYTDKLDIRERIKSSGLGVMADYELVAAVLGSGLKGKDVRTLSKELLQALDLSAGVPEPEYFAVLRGIGQARACRLSAALELGRRFYGHRGQRISCPQDAWQLVRHFDDRKQERFLCCLLNGANDVLDVRLITLGLVNRTIIHPREIFAEAVAARACAVIVAHNHPSGRLEPSQEDRDITERLRAAGELLGISLLDHLIFSQVGFVSLVETGVLQGKAQ
jgi:DNA repair protein RadC